MGASVALPLWVVYALVGVLCVLLVCPLRMFSLKFAGFGWRGNGLRYFFLAAAAVVVAVFGLRGVAMVMGGYVAVSAIFAIFAR